MTLTAATPLTALKAKLQPLYARLAAHPLYASLRTAQHLRTFLEATSLPFGTS